MGFTPDTATGKPIYDGDITDPVAQFQAAANYAEKVGTRRTGTTTQKDAATQTPNGWSWWDTTLNRLSIRVAGQWRPGGSLTDADYREATTAGNGVVGVAHSLGAVPRSVIVTGTGRGAVPGELTFIVTAKTETGFNVNVFRNGYMDGDTWRPSAPFAANPVGFHWVAIA